nr:integrase, catalytic region, zinc finger, CCHC-type, peptidase aspartic, catalytic [Tanacetum cinerariifolium]
MSIQDSTPAPTNSSNTPVSSPIIDVQSQQHAQQQGNRTLSPTAYAADNVLNTMFEGDLFVNPFATPSTEKPDISYLHVFGALSYPKNDREDIGKLGAKDDIGFFIRYSANSVAYKVYNLRTKKIIETINVTFDELLAMAFEQNCSRPSL